MVQVLIKIKLKFYKVMLKLDLLPQFEVLLEYEGCVGLKWGKELNETSTDTRPLVICLQIMFCVKKMQPNWWVGYAWAEGLGYISVTWWRRWRWRWSKKPLNCVTSAMNTF